jgi:hypothetical protein
LENIDLVPIAGSDGDGILDLDFVGTPPTGIVNPVLTAVSGDFVISDGADRLSGVLVHARSNNMSAFVAGGGDATNPGGPSTGVDRFVSAQFGQVTTLAIGEEGVNTAAIGETHVFQPTESFAAHRAETMALIPSESVPGIGFEKQPITEKMPISEKIPIAEKLPVPAR